VQILSSSLHCSQHIQHETGRKKKKRPQKSDHQKKSLFPVGIRLFTSVIKSRMEGSASCHSQDRMMKIEEVRGLVEVEELRVTGLESLRMK
jgi:hypothetical protein